jgi:hypothetical protein
MKHKIAILTQPLARNYGGIIQNYALQKVFADLGHETITIRRDFDNPHSKIKILASKYKTLFFRQILKSKDPKYIDLNKTSKHNQIFLKKYIKLSPKLDDTNELSKYFSKEKFDGVVVGSDQVWRPKYSPNIFNFYLDFLEEKNTIKKVAYAASFGTEEWEYTQEQTRKCKELIQQFDSISVREDSGIQLCKEHLNRKDATHVLDPTLLLDAADYSQLIGAVEKNLGLFSYVLDDSIEKIEFIDNCAKELNLERSTNQAKFKTNTYKSDNIEDYIIPPLEGWLQGFRDAEFVITDSFHGTVFSILNKKPFLTLVNKGRGASRFESFLKQLGLEDRLIYNVKGFDESKLKDEINYEEIHLKLDILKSESISFLKNYI